MALKWAGFYGQSISIPSGLKIVTDLRIKNMGIDFHPGSAHWSYSGFNNFRERLAATIGMDLDSMQGFGGSVPFKNFKDDIIPLLNHSDCDGHLTAIQCSKVGPRLKELVKNWDDYDGKHALQLANDMIECANNKQKLIFC